LYTTEVKKLKTKNITIWLLGLVAILLLVNQYGISQLNSKLSTFSVVKTTELKTVEKGAKDVEVDFYVMSYCPYGNVAEEGLEPVYQLLKEKANFNPRYVYYSNYQGGGPNFCLDEESQYCSMHGVQEANQNIREQCVNKYFGADAFFEFALAMNQQCTYKNADACWLGVANSLGLDTAVIQKCFSEEALDFAASDKTEGDALSVRGSPTVFINNKPYNGQRTPEGYKQAVCSAFATPPPECEGVTLSTEGAAPEGGCG